tara:strand:+ start:192 stop:1076 length:885 start_codon:yes stop_codon:yes gene_type:complete
MRVLVTGGAGFVGTNLIKRLLKDGHEVASIDNYSTGKKENEQDGCTYLEHGLESLDHPSKFDKELFSVMSYPDVTFHLAARARIVPSFQDPISTFKSNTLATQNVLEWARKHNTPVIYAGTSSIHGDKLANPYTFTKHQGEELINLYNKTFDLPTAICRFYNVYGPHQLTEGDYCCVLGIFERQFTKGEPLTITGDGEQRRDFTHVDDIVDGLIKCGESIDKVSGEVFELGRGKNYSINEIVDAFGDYHKKYIEKKPGEMRETLNTNTKARDVLGWKPKNDILNYIRENYEVQK